MDGRLVLLGVIVAIAATTASNLEPVRPAGADRAERARQRAVDLVLAEFDRSQLCYRRRRDRYADTIPSLQFARGHFMRAAVENDLDIHLRTAGDGQGYHARVTGDGVDVVIERRGDELVRLDVGDRQPPRLTPGCVY